MYHFVMKNAKIIKMDYGTSDDSENWISDGTGDGTSFSNVFIHEIGHSLGLGHSKRTDAIMYPIYKKDVLENASFDLDDKCALNWNYSKFIIYDK